MAENVKTGGIDRDTLSDLRPAPPPRYAPPYPQNFHRFWPTHAIKAGILVVVVVALISVLAYYYSVPIDFNMAFPDDGMNIPGPEWYFLFIFLPFWYFTGELKGLVVLGTFVVPLLILIFLLLVPFVFKKGRRPGTGFVAWFKRAAVPLVLFVALMVGIYRAGAPAKITGCIACHTPHYGQRQYLPPMDVAEYYKTHRQRQIEVGKFRAGKLDTEGMAAIGGAAESYKDANWQLRHMYEPTFTW